MPPSCCSGSGATAKPPRGSGARWLWIRGWSARALLPKEAAAQFNAAFVLQRLGRDGEAAEGFRRALALDPGLERARAALAWSEARLDAH